MLDWTDRDCRFLHRLLTRHARLYTEMIHVGALLHGDAARWLQFDACEHPVALQLGGSDPHDLASAARLAAQWGYDEVNLNCGCPSERVQRGSFGACLMREPQLVADAIKAMRDAVTIPVTVKHRIGLDRDEDYAPVRDFVGLLAQAGCAVFIVHARNAWLKGLSPKENREVPPLRYEVVQRLKADFPRLTIVVNGGIRDSAQVHAHLQQVDGVMVGREAYHNPWWLSRWDAEFFGMPDKALRVEDVERAYVDYMDRRFREGAATMGMARHMLGLRNGQPGARRWRQLWSDHRHKHLRPSQILAMHRDGMTQN
ncbi:tRNA dihydrouridine(20/20a) synthase DusA [Lampropedia cohaerens]